MAQNKKLLNKNFIMLIGGLFFSAAGFMQLIPILPVFALNVIKLHEGEIGLLVGVFSVSSLLCRPLVGYALDNYPKNVIFSSAIALFTLSIFSFIFIVSPSFLILIRLIQGIAWASITTGSIALAMDMIPKEKRGEGIGVYSLALPMAMVVGPELGINILDGGHFQRVFIVSSLLCLIGFKLSLQLKTDKAVKNKTPFSVSPWMLYEKKALGTAFLQFCYNFAYSGTATFIPIYVVQKGLGRTSYFYLSFAFCVIISRIICRNTFDRKGPSFLIIPGFVFCIAGALAVASAESFILLLAGGMLYGIGGGLIIPALNTMALNVADPCNRGRSSATIYTALDLGTGIGAFSAGMIAKAASYEAAYAVAAAMAAAALLYFIFRGKDIYYKNVTN